MEQEQKATITIDDKNYVVEDLSEKAQYCIAQIQDLQQQETSAKARLDQIQVAAQGFTDILKSELPTDGE